MAHNCTTPCGCMLLHLLNYQVAAVCELCWTRQCGIYLVQCNVPEHVWCTLGNCPSHVAGVEMAVFLVPFSIVQYMPNLFYGALLCVTPK